MNCNLERNDSDFILMYHGQVIPGRDLERLLEIVSFNKFVKVVIMGNSSDDYKAQLLNISKQYSITDRVAFHSAVDIENLWKYVGAADAGIILARATCRNHYFSLPNKLFEDIISGTPVICPNYPAFASIIDEYQNGIMCDPNDINDINRCIERLRTDDDFYLRLKLNTMKAREVLNWETEKKALKFSYSQVLVKCSKNYI